MWSSFVGFMPPKLVLLCTVLSFIVPLSVYSVNQLLHKNGDPPWKQPQENETEHPTPPQSQS
ncbi:hypothetical protein [Paenibacillus planticolens]|uniref:Uncharacterized protein n=1 Tax=Paenibacillus planticolens TaxID=2654976 RepID=A0ABX1ZXX1_9BACL|nr:hypothetical protein [Paenibacillus planticolens]NOV03540.1 hypothetical protein [Paenibacillus planticolens]